MRPGEMNFSGVHLIARAPQILRPPRCAFLGKQQKFSSAIFTSRGH